MAIFIKNEIGLDIGDSTMKIVWLSSEGNIRSYNSINLPDGAIKDGVIKDAKIAADKIKELISSAKGDKVRSNQVNVCLPEPLTFLKVMNVPYSRKKKDIFKAVVDQVPHYFPLKGSNIYLDSQEVSPHKKDSEVIEVLVGVCPRSIVDSYVELISLAGLELVSLQVEALPIVNCLMPTSQKRKTQTETCITTLIVDLGENRSSLILCDRGTIRFTLSLNISGKGITEQIADIQKIDLKKAEQQKIESGLLESAGSKVYTIIEKNFSMIADEIIKSMRYYSDESGCDIKRIVVSGGGAKTKNICPYLSWKTGIEVVLGDHFLNFQDKDKQQKKFSEVDLAYTTAIGLALTR